jgi:hypothetical protein
MNRARSLETPISPLLAQTEGVSFLETSAMALKPSGLKNSCFCIHAFSLLDRHLAESFCSSAAMSDATFNGSNGLTK